MNKAVKLLSTGLTGVVVSTAGIACATPTALAASAASSSGPATCNALKSSSCLLQFNAKFVQQKKVSVGGSGPSLGDEMILSLDLFRGRTKVGVADGTFTTTRVHTSGHGVVVESQGLFTLRLPSGQLSLQFIQLDDHEEVLPVAVTGGSGAFRGAWGDGTITKGNNSGVIRLHLKFPGTHLHLRTVAPQRQAPPTPLGS